MSIRRSASVVNGIDAHQGRPLVSCTHCIADAACLSFRGRSRQSSAERRCCSEEEAGSQEQYGAVVQRKKPAAKSRTVILFKKKPAVKGSTALPPKVLQRARLASGMPRSPARCKRCCCALQPGALPAPVSEAHPYQQVGIHPLSANQLSPRVHPPTER